MTMSQPNQKSTFDTFTHWAKVQRQIYICDGVVPKTVGEVGEGSGIFAKRTVQAGERLVYIPTSALLTTDTVIAACGDVDKNNGRGEAQISSLPPLNCPAQALLAAYLTRTRNDPELRSWRATWPREEDLKTLPVKWSKDMRALLPGEAVSLTNRQRRRIEDDWDIMKEWISSGTNENDEERLISSFEYHWLIINTRTFYWPHAERLTKLHEALGPEKTSKNPSIGQDEAEGSQILDKVTGKGTATENPGSTRASEECLALCPWADLFNHTDEEFASATYDENGYTVTALRTYEKDEEIFVNYGSHSNDYLLAEYGFILTSNSDDSHNLDDIVLPNFTNEQEEVLKETGYYGKYTLSPQPLYLCFRTHAMLRLLTSSDENNNIDNEENHKFDGYYAFINTAVCVLPSERRQVALKALEVILDPLSEKCRRVMRELGMGIDLDMDLDLNADADSAPTLASEVQNEEGKEKEKEKEKRFLCNRWTQVWQMVKRAKDAASREVEINSEGSVGYLYVETGLV